jgi:hypothetical protein
MTISRQPQKTADSIQSSMIKFHPQFPDAIGAAY